MSHTCHVLYLTQNPTSPFPFSNRKKNLSSSKFSSFIIFSNGGNSDALASGWSRISFSSKCYPLVQQICLSNIHYKVVSDVSFCCWLSRYWPCLSHQKVLHQRILTFFYQRWSNDSNLCMIHGQKAWSLLSHIQPDYVFWYHL